jgi:transcriptional regulator with XRE-family HTH domain
MSADAIDSDEPLPEIDGDAIAEIRAKNRLSQGEFADLAGVGRTTLGSWENGQGMTTENQRRVIAAVRDLGHIDDGEVSIDETPIDDRVGEYTRGPGLSAAVNTVFDVVVQELRQMAHGEWYATHTTLTAANISASNDHRKSAVGRVLSVLANNPQPERDGFRIETYRTDRSGRPNRWVLHPVAGPGAQTESETDGEDGGTS